MLRQFGYLSGTALLALGSPALAVVVPNGAATFVPLFNPVVNFGIAPSTATFIGNTLELSGAGGFAPAAGQNGKLNGTITFSSIPGTVIVEPLTNFFVFNDNTGGTFNFSLTSVLTQSYLVNPGVNESFSLYLLGTTQETNLGYSATATSLTLTFNETGSSGFSASGTLAIPPSVPQIPEPATWATFILGFGLVGAGIRYRKTRSLRTAA